MRSADEEDWELKAAYYVLGLLSDQDKIVLDQLVQQDENFAQKVNQWEHWLDPLNSTTAAVKPPPGLLQRILNQIDLQSRRISNSNVPIEAYKKIRTRLRYWQAGFAASLLGGAVLGLMYLSTVQKIDALDSSQLSVSTVSVLEVEDGTPVWTINYPNIEDGKADTTFLDEEIIVTVVNDPSVDSGRGLQLWMVLDNDRGVQSVGMMPQQEGITTRFTLPAKLDEAIAFAVSDEKSGGVPGPEHGPVIAIDDILHPTAD